MSNPLTEFDTPWKDILQRYFEDFILFFFPQAHSEIDWTRVPEFLDKELQQVVREAELGRRLVDKLVKIWRTSGLEAWVLIHVEIQSQEESNFAERMFTYTTASMIVTGVEWLVLLCWVTSNSVGGRISLATSSGGLMSHSSFLS